MIGCMCLSVLPCVRQGTHLSKMCLWTSYISDLKSTNRNILGQPETSCGTINPEISVCQLLAFLISLAICCKQAGFWQPISEVLTCGLDLSKCVFCVHKWVEGVEPGVLLPTHTDRVLSMHAAQCTFGLS